MKIIWIVSDHTDDSQMKAHRIQSNAQLRDHLKKHDLQLVRVNPLFFNKKTGYFSKFFDFNEKGKFVAINKKCKPDMLRFRIKDWNLFYQDLFKKFKMLPDFKITHLSADKYEMALYLGKYQPATCLLSDFFDNKQIQKDTANKIVIKPIRSNWWKWILLFSKKELLKQREKFLWLENLYIVQEFKDFDKWYPWIVEGIHDVRLVFVWNKLSFSMVRQPAKWNFKSNIWSGWRAWWLPIQQIPKKLLLLAHTIQKELAIENKKSLYTLDFAYSVKEQKWYLLELNFSPWLWLGKDCERDLQKYFTDLWSLFKKIVL